MKAPLLPALAGFFVLALPCAAQSILPADSPEGIAPMPALPTSPAAAPEPGDAAETRPSVDPNYLLQPDDLIEVVVFREPDLTTQGMLRKDGCFDMKLLGTVKVGNLTVDAATEVVRAALAKDYLVDPRVNLSIVSYARKKINILGEVRGPALYTFPEHGSLMLSDAIAMAGGLLPSADAAHIMIKRLENDRVQSLEVNASPSTGTSDKFEVRPDDAISVPVLPRRHFTVLGQINRPGTYDVADDRPVYLTDAIALAGGFTRIANPSRVLLKRTEAGREVVMEFNAKAMANSAATQRFEIQNEDTITVTESMF